MIRGDFVLRRIELTSHKLVELAHFYSLFEVRFLEGELWLSKMGSYLPGSIWNFYAVIPGLIGRRDFGTWSYVLCFQPYFYFLCLVDSLFLPCTPLLHI